jgi:DNA repair protein RadC
MHARNTDPAPYAARDVVAEALALLETRITAADALTSPALVREYLTVRAGARQDQHREVFGALWLDPLNRPIGADDLFTGTLTQTSVYPREVIRAALARNASAVIITHNHPSGNAEPSRADIVLTEKLKKALDLIDVRLIDHVITAGGKFISLAEKGVI